MINVGDRVLLPCYYCDSSQCPHQKRYAMVTHIGSMLVTVKLEQPPTRWRERGLSDHTKYGANRLKVV